MAAGRLGGLNVPAITVAAGVALAAGFAVTLGGVAVLRGQGNLGQFRIQPVHTSTGTGAPVVDGPASGVVTLPPASVPTETTATTPTTAASHPSVQTTVARRPAVLTPQTVAPAAPAVQITTTSTTSRSGHDGHDGGTSTSGSGKDD